MARFATASRHRATLVLAFALALITVCWATPSQARAEVLSGLTATEGEARPSDEGTYEALVPISVSDREELLSAQESVTWKLHVWTSFTGMGEETNRTIRIGDTVYLCYEILDQNWNPLSPSDYGWSFVATENIYNADGSLRFSHQYGNSRDNWISVTYGSESLTGTQTANVEISGDISGSCGVSWELEDTVPSITRQPTPREAMSGSDVTFSVGATGTHLSYQWYRNISPSSSVNIPLEGCTSPSCTVTASSSTSGYYYYCKIYNYGNTIYSDRVTLTTKYSITYDANGGSGAPYAQTKVHANDIVLSGTTPTREGYIFKGWATAKNGTDRSYSPGEAYSYNADLALYAIWEEKPILDISLATVEKIDDQYYTGGELRPAPTVTYGGKVLARDKDYVLIYFYNVDVGVATIRISGVGDYQGNKIVTYNIITRAPSPSDEPLVIDKDGWVPLPDGGKGYRRGGKLVTGWMDIGTSKYWFREDGAMATGWTDVVVDGKTMHYYFNPASGNLVRGTWFEIEGHKYYFRPSGNVAHGWATIEDGGVEKKYYFDDGYRMVTGWRDIDNGQGVTNHYYFRPAGSMATGWATIDGQKYWFRPSGNMATGFATVDDGHKRYFDEGGIMQVGWQQIGGRTYYFRPSGAMQTGEATIDGAAYRFSDSGTLSAVL